VGAVLFVPQRYRLEHLQVAIASGGLPETGLGSRYRGFGDFGCGRRADDDTLDAVVVAGGFAERENDLVVGRGLDLGAADGQRADGREENIALANGFHVIAPGDALARGCGHGNS